MSWSSWRHTACQVKSVNIQAVQPKKKNDFAKCRDEYWAQCGWHPAWYVSIDFEAATDGDTKNHFDLVKWCEQTGIKGQCWWHVAQSSRWQDFNHRPESNTLEVQFEKLVKF